MRLKEKKDEKDASCEMEESYLRSLISNALIAYNKKEKEMLFLFRHNTYNSYHQKRIFRGFFEKNACLVKDKNGFVVGFLISRLSKSRLKGYGIDVDAHESLKSVFVFKKLCSFSPDLLGCVMSLFLEARSCSQAHFYVVRSNVGEVSHGW